MITKDVWAGDIALIELQRDGSTEAPPDVLASLASRGHVKLSGQTATLTAEGRNRASILANAEHDIRAMAGSVKAGRCPITTAGGASLRM